MNLPTAEDVHRFWFGEVTDWAACARENNERWFRRGRDLDAPVRERFPALLEAAAAGSLAAWRETPRGALALVLTLDQFPRHIHRGTPRAFATDEQALGVCRGAIAAELDESLSPVEQSFLYLPLEHAEDPAAQAQCVALMRGRAEQCPPELRFFMDEAVRFAEVHREIVDRFGRFPHRNEVLGRAHTPAERAWLDAGGARFGQ